MDHRAEQWFQASGDRDLSGSNVGPPKHKPSIRPRDQVHPLPTPDRPRQVREGRGASRELQLHRLAEHRLQGRFTMPPGAPAVPGVESPLPATTKLAFKGFTELPAPLPSAAGEAPQAGPRPHGAVSRPARWPSLREGRMASSESSWPSRGENRPHKGAQQAADGVQAPQLAAWTRVRGAGLPAGFVGANRAGGRSLLGLCGQQQQGQAPGTTGAGPGLHRSARRQRRLEIKGLLTPIARPPAGGDEDIAHEHPGAALLPLPAGWGPAACRSTECHGIAQGAAASNCWRPTMRRR